MKLLLLTILLVYLQAPYVNTQCNMPITETSELIFAGDIALASCRRLTFGVKITSVNPSSGVIAFKATDPASVFALENGYCDGYSGEDASGEYIGRISGPYGFEYLFAHGNAIFLDCLFADFRTGYSVISVGNFTQNNVSATDLPQTFEFPVSLRDGLEVTFISETRCDFVFDVGSYAIDNGPFITVTSEDGPGASLNDPDTSFNVPGEPTEIISESGTYATLASVSIIDGTNTHEVEVRASCDLPPTEQPIEVKQLECSESPVISLNEDDLNELGVNATDQIIIWPERLYDASSLPSQCIADADNPVFNINITDCGAIIEVDDENVYVTYVVRNQPGKNDTSPIQRYDDNCFNRTCKFNKTQLLNSTAIFPQIRKTTFDPMQEEGSFVIEMDFCSDENCTQLLPAGSTVIVSDYINVETKLSEIDPSEDEFILQVTNSWATPSSDPNDVVKYTIIEGGCPKDNDFDPVDAIISTRNNEPIYANFQFRSFVWTNVDDDEQVIYVHSYVTVCDDQVETCTGPICSKRRRRNDAGNREGEIVSVGPIYLKSNKETCEKDNGGCSDNCLIHGGYVICSCYEDRILTDDQKSCGWVQVVDVGSIGVEDHAINILAIFVIVFAIIMAFAYFMYSRIAGKKYIFDM